MKQFIFDRLIDRENICGLKQEVKQLQKLVDGKQNTLIYAPRNFGKTSLVKNITIEDFRKKHKKSLVFFVDLMGVRDIDSITLRLKNALETSIRATFPVKNILSGVASYFTNLKIEMDIDVMDLKPTIKISPKNNKSKLSIGDIFATINKINQDIPSLIVIDEFQDVALIDEAESLFRNAFQQIQNLPIVILGSKKHLLKNIFALPKSPLANWGKDLTINPINYEEYHQYVTERFKQRKLKINFEDCQYLQDVMQRVPEAINILCYEICQNHEKKNIDQKIIKQTINQILDVRRKRFETMLAGFSIAEEKIATGIARENQVSQPQSKDFTAKTNLTARSVKANIDKLMDQGIIDFDDKSYHLCDPLFGWYLREFR
jgi:AAA+ ATPase superfamily predicted ATPase